MRSSDYRGRARNDLRGNLGSILLISLIFLILTVVVPLIPFIGGIAGLIIIGPLTLGFVLCIRHISHGYKCEVGQLFSGFNNFVGPFVFYFLSSLFVVLWSLLFFIPGFIKTLEYSMGYYILADNPGMDGNEARIQSMKLMKGHRWELFCLEFSFIGWHILSALTFGILSIYVAPYRELSLYHFYQEISGQNKAKLYEAVDQTVA